MLRSSLQPCCLSFRHKALLEAGRTQQRASKRAASILSAPIDGDGSDLARNIRLIKGNSYERSKEVYTSPTATMGHYGVVTTLNPSATPFQQLVSEVPRLEEKSMNLLDLRVRTLLVLLITPSYAHILDAPHNPLLALQKRLFGLSKNSMMEYQVLAAVVDRVPAPTAVSIEDEPHSVTSRTHNPPVANDGLEGLAYAIMSPAALRQAEAAFETDEASPAFSIRMRSKRDLKQDVTVDYEVTLPLANTIFQNGREHTMRHYTFKRKKNYAPLTLKTVVSYKRHAITWPAHISGKFGNSIVSLSTPLVPLTVPLRIEAAMGNIISRVTDHNQKVAPASQQLEASVNEYFAVTNSPPHAVTVWALMYPTPTHYAMETLETYRKDTGIFSTSGLGTSSQKNIQSYWKSQQGWNDHILRSVWRGAKLHRVVSGGGGWGKKAGLLSLDPYTTPLETPRTEDEASGPTSFNFMKGDYLQFFICPPINEDNTPAPVDSSARLAPRDWSLEFGSMTSAMDAMPHDTKSDTPDIAAVQVFPNHFGAISEKGFTIQNTYAYYTDQGYDSFRTFAYSKVDVPHSRWSAVSTISEAKERSIDNTPGTIWPSHVLQLDFPSKQPRRFDELPPGKSTSEDSYYWAGVHRRKKFHPTLSNHSLVRKSLAWGAKDLPPAARAWLLLQREQRHQKTRGTLRQQASDDAREKDSYRARARASSHYRRSRVFIRGTFAMQRPRNNRERAVGRHHGRDHYIRHVSILSPKDMELLKKNNEIGVEVRRLDGGYGAERRRQRRLRAILLREKGRPPPARRPASDRTDLEAANIEKSVEAMLKGFGGG